MSRAHRKPVFETLLQQASGSLTALVALALGAMTLYFFYKKRATPRDSLPRPTQRPGSLGSVESKKKDDVCDVMTRIKKKMFIGQKICIAFETLCGENGWKADGVAKEVLCWYAFSSDVYVMCRIRNVEEKKRILSMLKDIEGLQRHKVLFCTTQKGYEAFTRQISPALLITHDTTQVEFLCRILPYIVLVGSHGVVRGNVACIDSVELLHCADE